MCRSGDGTWYWALDVCRSRWTWGGKSQRGSYRSPIDGPPTCLHESRKPRSVGWVEPSRTLNGYQLLLHPRSIAADMTSCWCDTRGRCWRRDWDRERRSVSIGIGASLKLVTIWMLRQPNKFHLTKRHQWVWFLWKWNVRSIIIIRGCILIWIIRQQRCISLMILPAYHLA